MILNHSVYHQVVDDNHLLCLFNHLHDKSYQFGVEFHVAVQLDLSAANWSQNYIIKLVSATFYIQRVTKKKLENCIYNNKLGN